MRSCVRAFVRACERACERLYTNTLGTRVNVFLCVLASVCLPVYRTVFCLSVSVPVCPFSCPSYYLSNQLSICLSTCTFLPLPVRLSACLSLCLLVNTNPFPCPSVCAQCQYNQPGGSTCPIASRVPSADGMMSAKKRSITSSLSINQLSILSVYLTHHTSRSHPRALYITVQLYLSNN